MMRNGFPMVAAAAMALGIAAAGAASAQTDAGAMAQRSAANQLGVLEYCHGRGDVGPDAIDAEKSVIGHLPTSTAATSDAESVGKGGSLVLPDGSSQSLSSMASRTNVSVSALCGKLGESAVRSAAIYKNGGMPGVPGGMQMPAMPNGGQMPAMPNGMAMPSMPGAPATPSSPPS